MERLKKIKKPDLNAVVKDVQRLSRQLMSFNTEPVRVLWTDAFGCQHVGYTQPSMGLQG